MTQPRNDEYGVFQRSLREIITLYALKLGAQPFTVGALAPLQNIVGLQSGPRTVSRIACLTLVVLLLMTFSNSTQGRSGEAMGLRVTVINLTRMIGQVVFGSIGSACGVFSVFWLNAIMLASGWAVSHPLAEDRREDRRHEES